MNTARPPTRREPPAFRRVMVRGVEALTPRLVRVTVGGPDLVGFALSEPAASVRLLLPAPGSDELVIPLWHTNEFLMPDGSRPTIRTFTPRRMRAADELDLEIVLHGEGVASTWASAAEPGIKVAVSGPGRGYSIDAAAPEFVLAGDETALPALCQLLEHLPNATPVQVHIEIAHADARLELADHPLATLHWHELTPGAEHGDALVAAVTSATFSTDARIWAAGEAAAVQRVRKHLFEIRGIPRAHASVRGYWKDRVAGDSGDA